MSDDVVANLRSQIARLTDANAFEALGIDYDADGDAVRAAFLAATKKYHPSRFARMDRDVVKLANEVFLQLKDAYTLLRDDTRRATLSEKYESGSSKSGPRPSGSAPSGNGAGARTRFAERSRRGRAAPSRSGSSPRGRRAGTVSSGRGASQSDSDSRSSVVRKVNASTRRGGAGRAATQSTVRGVGGRIPRPTPPSADRTGQREAAAVADSVHSNGKQHVESVKAAITDTIRRRNQNFEKALSLNHAGQHEQARKLLQQVAIEEPKEKKYRLFLHYVWGLEHEAAGRGDEAGAEYRRALNIDPTFKRAHEALGRLEADKKGFFKKFFTR